MKGRILLGSRQETLAMDSLEQANLLPESRPESHHVSNLVKVINVELDGETRSLFFAW